MKLDEARELFIKGVKNEFPNGIRKTKVGKTAVKKCAYYYTRVLEHNAKLLLMLIENLSNAKWGSGANPTGQPYIINYLRLEYNSDRYVLFYSTEYSLFQLDGLIELSNTDFLDKCKKLCPKRAATLDNL